MATTLSVADSINYPDNSKTLSVDITSIVDYLSEGDELWFLKVSTSAKASGSTSIDDELVSYALNGYSRSSGLVSGPFTVSSGSNYLTLSIDGSLDREIIVSPSTYTGSTLATELQTKIKALADNAAAEAGNLSFKNASVDFINNKFEIKSGTISNAYTGSGASSVVVTDGTTVTGLAAVLGFDLPFESKALSIKMSGISVTKVSSSSSGTTLNISNSAGFSDGDALYLADSTGSTQYVVIASGGGTATLTVTPTLSKTWAAGTKVQKVVETDPESVPTSPLSTVDKLLRKAISSIVSQIDFSI